MLFTGRYKHQLDASGRLSIPAPFRSNLSTGSISARRRHRGIFLIPCRVSKVTGGAILQNARPQPVIMCAPEELMSSLQEKLLDVLPKYLKIEHFPIFEVARQAPVTEEGRIHVPLEFVQHLFGFPDTQIRPKADAAKHSYYVNMVGWGALFAIERDVD